MLFNDFIPYVEMSGFIPSAAEGVTKYQLRVTACYVHTMSFLYVKYKELN